MSDRPLSRRLRWALTLLVATLLVSGVGSVYLRQGPSEVTVDDAVASFRAASATADAGATGTLAPNPADAAVVPAASDPAPPGAEVPTSALAATSDRPARTAAAGSSASAPAPTAQPSASAPAKSAEPTAAPPPPGQVEATAQEGVYTYTTEGYEATNALGGARHDYPKQTPVTMRRTECGWTQRWQPLDERWDESALCSTATGMDVHRFTTYHEFFQKGQQQQFDCPPGSAVHRRDAAPGTTWSWRCTAGPSAIDTVVTVVGPEPVIVEGREIAATRVHYESTMSGANRGTQKQDRWIAADGMNLRIKTDIDTEADSPFGAVHYEEHYVITVASLTPRR